MKRKEFLQKSISQLAGLAIIPLIDVWDSQNYNSKMINNTISQKVLPGISAAENFNNTWPYNANYSDAPGFRMHYIMEGQGETILALHGEPTWGYLFRNLIKSLSSRYRVVVPDHMGFGKSEVPQNRTYLLQDHIDNLEQLILDLDLRDISLVMHDFGGPTGMGLAIRHPDRIRRIISTNGPTPLGQPGLMDALVKNASESPWFKWILESNENGSLEQILGHLDYNILSTLKLNGFENHHIINETWLDAYRRSFKGPQYCLGAIGWAKGFAEAAHQFEPADKTVISELSSKPALAIWGMADQTLKPDHFIPLFEEAFTNREIHRLYGVGHYCHEDAPLTISKLIDRFIVRS